LYSDLLLFSSLVYLPLAGGSLVRHSGLLKKDISQQVMRGTWLLLEPVIIVISFWSLDLKQVADLAAAPILGSVWMVAMLGPGALVASRLRLRHPQRGNFLLATMFSNNGITLGGSLCMVLFGVEAGLPMAMLFTLGFMPLLLTVGFGIARRSAKHAALAAGGSAARVPRLGMLRLVPYGAMAAGLALNIVAARQPRFAPVLVRYVVFGDVVIYSFAIGTLFALGSVRRFLRECVVISCLKFLLSPLVGLAIFFAVSQLADLSPLLLQVTIVQCAMPVAIMSVVLSRFCSLDTQLAAACWVFTTLAVAPIVPLLAYVTLRFA
jgi:predicted permease